jgi:hypothetical protein
MVAEAAPRGNIVVGGNYFRRQAGASELEVNEFLGLAQKRQAACEGRSY